MYNTHEAWQLALQAPFAIDEIKQRPLVIRQDKTAAIPANYVDARTVMARLDTVAGPFNWQVQYEEIKGVVYARLGLRNPDTDEWIWKSDAGSESRQDAAKGEASDAFKRAAVRFGIGRHLYAIPDKWVDGYRRKDGKFAFDNESLDDYRTWLAQWMDRYQQPAILDSAPNGNGASTNGSKVQDVTPPDADHLEEIRSLLEATVFNADREEYLSKVEALESAEAANTLEEEIRKEKNHRANQRESFRSHLERAKTSFEGIGEESKFHYQLQKAYDTTSIEKIIEEHWQDEAGVLETLRKVFSDEKAAV